MPVVLLDTTLLSNFAHVWRPDLLPLALGQDIATTPLSIAELRTGEALGLVPTCDWSWLTVLQPTDAENAIAKGLGDQLDSGEAECLAVAQVRNCKFLSDDLAARRLALHRKLTVSGTLGVLLHLVRMKLLTLTEADELLTVMIGHGYRSPVRSLEVLLP